MRDEVAPSVSS